MSPLALAKEQFRAGKSALFESLVASGVSSRGIHARLHQLAKHTDHTLQTLWLLAEMPPEAALVAVGGYGRGQLFPYSDVDVVLLLADDSAVVDNPELTSKIEKFISNCWDTGLEIGSSVRTVAECVEESAKDVTVQTSLLEARRITGHKKNVERLKKQLAQAMDAQLFLWLKRWNCASATTSMKTHPMRWSPIAKSRPVACATCKPFCG